MCLFFLVFLLFSIHVRLLVLYVSYESSYVALIPSLANQLNLKCSSLYEADLKKALRLSHRICANTLRSRYDSSFHNFLLFAKRFVFTVCHFLRKMENGAKMIDEL